MSSKTRFIYKRLPKPGRAWVSHLEKKARNKILKGILFMRVDCLFSVVLTAFSLSSNSEGQRTIPENCSKM
jgi:hypothetical protein